MALNNVIRRASRVVPLAIRASAGSQRYLHHHHGAAVLAAVSQPSRNFLPRAFPSAIHHFSTKPKSDESLVRVIQSEIKCALDTQEEEDEVEIPESFPFQIEDIPGQQTIKLTRDYDGENITVEVHMPDLSGDEENEKDDDDEEQQGEEGSQSCIPMVVTVSKKNGPSLEFGITAYADEISIDTLSIKDAEGSEDEIAYEGPDFGDLDENLQKSFHKYLEIRGIKPSTTNFLHEYMISKDGREYVAWLENLQKFVQA